MSDNIAKLVGMLAVGKDAQFASFVYRSKGTNELAKIVVKLGAKTEDLYNEDMVLLKAILESIDPETEPLRFEACSKIIASREESLTVGIGKNSAYTHQDTYVYPVGLAGFRIHKETGEVYVNGLIHNKVTLEEGEYKVVKSRPLTIEKQKIEKDLPSGKFRQYTLRGIQKVTMNGVTLEIEAE